jgi:hypothetical protein
MAQEGISKKTILVQARLLTGKNAQRKLLSMIRDTALLPGSSGAGLAARLSPPEPAIRAEKRGRQLEKTRPESGFCERSESASARLEKPLKNPI